MMKYAFYFTLKSLFILKIFKIFKFLSWLSVMYKNGFIRKKTLILNLNMSQPGNK